MLEFLGGDRDYWLMSFIAVSIITIIYVFLMRLIINLLFQQRNTLDKYRTRFGFNTEIEFTEVKDVNKVAKREFHYNKRMEKEKQREEKKKEPKGPIS